MNYVYNIDYSELEYLFDFTDSEQIQIIEESQYPIDSEPNIRFVKRGKLLPEMCKKSNFNREFVTNILGSNFGIMHDYINKDKSFNKDIALGSIIKDGQESCYLVIYRTTDYGRQHEYRLLRLNSYKMTDTYDSSIERMINASFTRRIDDLTWEPAVAS